MPAASYSASKWPAPAPALDHDRVPALDELIRAAGQQRHAIFLFFDFFWNADNHGN